MDLPQQKKSSSFDRILFILFICSLILWGYLLGFYTGDRKIFPYKQLRSIRLGAEAFILQAMRRTNPYGVNHWDKVVWKEKKVTRYDASKTYPGYTLYTSGHDSSAFLVDMHGQIVHVWKMPFSKAWPKATHIKSPAPDDKIIWKRVIPFPNGDLLALYETDFDSPYGYGLIKIDKHSNLIWKFSEKTHHDVTVDEQGNIYALIHFWSKARPPGLNLIRTPWLDEGVVKLNAEGVELERMTFSSMFKDAEWSSLGNTIRGWDPFHTNSLQVLDAETAAALDFAQQGDLLLTIRNMNVVALVRPSLKKFVWFMRGAWLAPHDGQFLRNGNLIIFDNRGVKTAEGERSRVLELDPQTQKVIWRYPGNNASPYFYSMHRGRVHRLPNGNTLITESNTGRLFEVTPDHQVAWEYINPVRGEKSENYIAVVEGGLRLAKKEVPFLEEKP